MWSPNFSFASNESYYIHPSSLPAIFINIIYYISRLVRVLWLVNLADRTLLHTSRSLKFKVFLLLPNCCMIHHEIVLTYIASKSLKLSFTVNCVLKRVNDLKMISNWLVLLSTCFRNLKQFLMNGNHSRTCQTHNRDIILYILLTSSSWSVM